ncbi:cytochrome P450 71A6-like [Sesamum indicum]|uniref:Cytochrome P450 71A6-like n=1 Tax=Sesamum indicum TaxID=4182 RepID=A0A6I9SQU9_SESIN|nr:cytochrome P450 71A6-like [Sesamum indicum]
MPIQRAMKMVAYQTLIVPLVSILLFIIFLHKRRYTAAPPPRKRLPPSPRKLPIIGNLHQLGVYPHRSFQALSRRYGQLMLLHLGQLPVLVASSADAACEIMRNQDLIFSNRPKLSIPDRLTYGSRDVAFVPYGEYWRKARSICVLQLLSNKRVQSFRRVREEETSNMIDKIRQLGSSSLVVDLSDVLVTTTNNVFCRVALGRKYGDEDGEGRKIKKVLKEFVELLGTSSIGDYIPWLGWTSRVNDLDVKVEKIAKLLDEFLEGVIQEHRDRDKGEKVCDDGFYGDGGLDFVDILLEFQTENKGSSPPVEVDTIKAIILDMFAAGTDTLASSLEWAIAELIRNPRSMKSLQNEVREAAGMKEEISEEDLEKMHYLKAVIKESLRLHAPVPLLIARESTQDTKLMGYHISAGTQVIVNAWAIGRDPSLWENPQEFHPERFLDTSIDFRGLHFELIPFGAGRRGCPGVAFAVAVNELALAKLVHKFEFALPDGGRGEDLDMTESYGITVRRKSPLLVVTTPHTCHAKL